MVLPLRKFTSRSAVEILEKANGDLDEEAMPLQHHLGLGEVGFGFGFGFEIGSHYAVQTDFEFTV
jgi:hypothetical protein